MSQRKRGNRGRETAIDARNEETFGSVGDNGATGLGMPDFFSDGGNLDAQQSFEAIMEGLRSEGLVGHTKSSGVTVETEEADAANEETFGAGAEPPGGSAMPRFFQQGGGAAQPYDLQSWLASDSTLDGLNSGMGLEANQSGKGTFDLDLEFTAMGAISSLIDDQKTAKATPMVQPQAPPETVQELNSLDELERQLAGSLELTENTGPASTPPAVSLEELEKQMLAGPQSKTPPPGLYQMQPQPPRPPVGAQGALPPGPNHYFPRMGPPANQMPQWRGPPGPWAMPPPHIANHRPAMPPNVVVPPNAAPPNNAGMQPNIAVLPSAGGRPRPRSWASAVNPRIATPPRMPMQQLPPVGNIVRPPRPDLPLILITRNGPVPLPTNLTPDQVAAAQANARGAMGFARPPFPTQGAPMTPPAHTSPRLPTPRGYPTAILSRPQGPGRPMVEPVVGARPMGLAPPRPRGMDQRPAFRGGSMMSPRDVHYVVQQQLRPLQTQNPYRDDFYFHQRRLRKVQEERKAQGDAKASEEGLETTMTPVPKDARELTRREDHAQGTQAKQTSRSKEWNEKFRILGHSAKRSAFTPKALLSIPSLSSKSRNEEENESNRSKQVQSGGEGGEPFSNRLWRVRQLCDKLAVLLLDFQEVQHLAKVESQGQQQGLSADVQRQVQGVFQRLLLAVGLDGIPSMTNLLKSLSKEMALLMSVSKARKLLQRSLPLLPTSERIKVLTQALQYVCRTIPPADNDAEADLLRDFSRLVSGSGEERASQGGGSSGLGGGLQMDALLPCVEAMIASAELDAALVPRAASSFREALGSEPRAKLAHAVMQRGENLSAEIKSMETADPKDTQLAMKWDAYQQRFLDLVMQGL